MIITPKALDGREFSSFNVAAGFAVGDQSGPSRSPVLINRADDSPIYAGMRVDGRTIPIAFNVLPGHDITNDTGYVLQNLLAMLRPGESQERTLVVELADGPNIGTQLEARVSVGQYRYDFRNNLLVDFHMADERWYERTPTILSTVSFTGPVAIPLLNHGGATVSPIIEIGYSAQRTTESSTVGWKWRRTKSIANGGDRNWNRVRLTIDLGDTAAWVTAGKALANGNDLRVRFEGRELYRTLTNFNTYRTFVHFVGTIPAGGSAIYEIVYGNPDATAPRTLSTRTSHYDTYVADDLQGDAGTVTAGTTTTLTDSSASWAVNQWAGGFVGIPPVRYRRILSNTATVLTLNRATTAPAAGTSYVLWKSGIFLDGGLVTAKTANTITDNQHTDKLAPDSLVGGTVTFIGGSGATPATMTVSSNTTDTITFTTSFSVQPAVNDQYTIARYGILNYQVDKSIASTAHRGLWRSSHYSSNGGEITFGDRTPGGFIPWLMVDNQDQFAQLRVTDETAGASVANWPYLSARRRVRSDLTMPEKGQADGVCLYDPRGLVSFDWNYRVENDNGIGAVTVLVQSPDGDDWNQIVASFTTHGTMTAVTSGEAAGGYSVLTSGSEDPVRIYFGMLPAGGLDSEIASTESKNRNAEVRNHTRMMVFLSLDDISGLTDGVWVIGAEAAVYDLNVTGRLGGGAVGSEVPPYASFAVGGAGHYLHLAAGQKLWINPAPSAAAPLFGLYDASDNLVSRLPYAGVISRHELNADGNDTALVDYSLLMPPGANMITTGEDNITGWSISSSAGVVASLSNDTTTVFDGGSTSLKVTFTNTLAGAWGTTLVRTGGRLAVIPGSLYEFGFVSRRNGMTSAVAVRMVATWSYGGGTVSVADPAQSFGPTMTAADTWYPAGTGRKVHPGSVATPATTEVEIKITITGTGLMTGTIYLDPITFGVPNLYLTEAEIGTLTADIKWIEAVLA